jgi:hypothetical protein
MKTKENAQFNQKFSNKKQKNATQQGFFDNHRNLSSNHPICCTRKLCECLLSGE